MKTLYIVLILSFASISVFAQSTYTITAVSGKVEISLAGTGWKTASIGDSVPVSATISTGFRSNATLEGMGATLTIEPLTRMSVNELRATSGGGTDTNLGLRTGRIRASVRSTSSGRTNFRVSSPVATAAVRGTEFGFNGYRVDVGTGTVGLVSGSSGKTVNIPQGANSKVDENGNPIPVAESKAEQSIVDSSAIPAAVDPMISPGKVGGSSGSKPLVIIIE